ncbi:MAG: hypothetical protein AAB393_07935, partial [Bacteroidota bacterium]
LVVSNFGAVVSLGNVIVGAATNSYLSSSNALIVAGGNLVVTNEAHNNTLEVRRGTLQVQGAGGAIMIDNFTATNNNTITFVADVNGVTPIDVGQAFTINTNTILNIDLSAYDKSKGNILTLASYGSMPTKFAPENITITPSGILGRLDQTIGNEIRFIWELGTVIVVH